LYLKKASCYIGSRTIWAMWWFVICFAHGRIDLEQNQSLQHRCVTVEVPYEGVVRHMIWGLDETCIALVNRRLRTIYNHKCQCFHEKLAGNLVDPITGTNLYWWNITRRIGLDWSNCHSISWDVIKYSKCLLTCDQTVYLLQIDVVEYHKESFTHSLPHSQIIIESHSGPATYSFTLSITIMDARLWMHKSCKIIRFQYGRFLRKYRGGR